MEPNRNGPDNETLAEICARLVASMRVRPDAAELIQAVVDFIDKAGSAVGSSDEMYDVEIAVRDCARESGILLEVTDPHLIDLRRQFEDLNERMDYYGGSQLREVGLDRQDDGKVAVLTLDATVTFRPKKGV